MTNITIILLAFSQNAQRYTVIRQQNHILGQDCPATKMKACAELNTSSRLNSATSRNTMKQKSLLIQRNTIYSQTEWKTYLKVGQMTSDPNILTPFVIEWIPNLLPRMNIGELTIKFEFGHQKNFEIDSNV